jgi:hypothetical protein
VTYEAEIPSSFSEDISEIELNIPLDEDFIFDEIQILSDEKSSKNNRTQFNPSWTVKVKTYSDKDRLIKDLVLLKDLGFKVYSRYEKSSIDKFNLYVGPTLIKEDSLKILEDLKILEGFSPEVKVYD